MYKTIIGMLAISIAMLSATAMAAPIIIDDFTTPQDLLPFPGSGETTSSEVSGDGILGGSRELVLTNVPIPGNDTTPLTAGFVSILEEDRGVLNYSNQGETISVLDVVWDSGSGSPGLGGIDLTDLGSNNAFEIVFGTTDLDFTYSFEVKDIFGNVSNVSVSSPPLLGLASTSNPLSVFVAFDLFSGTVDFTAVDAIIFSLSSDILTFDSTILGVRTAVSEVPIPGAFVFMLSGLAGAGFLGRKKRKQISALQARV